MAAFEVKESGRAKRVIRALYPSAAATNYVAVCEPEPLHIQRTVLVRAWPGWLRRWQVFLVVNHAHVCEARRA